ncbi:hypothetical protein [Variovorax sp. PBL-E5]|uniref:hypothetical protein n=1 Tax=Variovorax sp. PBL-E5 TaxID=434014 RepID=UPI0013166D94|nr:hypothetical protein [Variovorax sp. PBL-E5]VTU45853.1 hypothetical protein E5P2_00378 [Variovorax sp. PBL-E5]
MILIASSERARATRHARTLANGFSFHRSEWIEGGDDASLSPTVFLVEQPAGAVLAPHFHMQNQFQIVMAGHGRLGAHEVAQGSVHYAGAFTGYGPVVAGPEGLSYFTVRAVLETGANFIENARDKMVRGPKCHVQGPPLPAASDGELAALPAPRSMHLIAPQPDRLEACVWYLPPHTRIDAPPPAPGGQFHFAMAGSLRHGQAWLGGWESRYLSAREPSCRLEAGPRGLQVLVLQMPAKAAEYCA